MISTDSDLLGRCALVTGGGTGIGRAIALALGRRGARVAVLGRRTGPLESVVASLQSEGGEGLAVPCDLLRDSQLSAALGMVEGFLGSVEILVNNAGIAPSGPLKLSDDETLDRAMAMNLRVPLILSKRVVPAMKEAGWGRIVNIASTAAVRGTRYTAIYTATKHALGGLTRSLAAELIGDGICVNAVCPGFCDTQLVEEAAKAVAERSGLSAAEVRQSYAALNPLGRLVRPEEVAAAVLYLVGPNSGAISGQSLIIDGGTQPV